MVVQPINNERLSDRVVNQILAMLREGTLQAGDKLPTETIFAEQLGISRGILREALTQLQLQGYIRRKPKDGTYIDENVNRILMGDSVNSIIKKATYSDLLDFREALELRMVECVIDRATDEEIEELFDCLNPALDNEQQLNMDHYFHYKLACASENIFFMNFIDTYYDLINEIAVNSKHDQNRRNEIVCEHRAIADAIARKDKAAARAAVTNHMRMLDKKIAGMNK